MVQQPARQTAARQTAARQTGRRQAGRRLAGRQATDGSVVTSAIAGYSRPAAPADSNVAVRAEVEGRQTDMQPVVRGSEKW